ncbi:MAG TPA: response regulator [Kofleriaceae bacterium]|nr:response regulator [Kofleriaceae bacterium]
MAGLRVAIFDDVVAARREIFHIPGLAVEVFAHADDAPTVCVQGAFDVVCMDFAMGPGRKSGAIAVTELRAGGFSGRIVAISSDPAANAAMRRAGADDSLGKKAHLRSFLVHLGSQHLGGRLAQGS